MRLTSLLRKTTLENLRDWKILVLMLSFAPFFTVLMHFYFQSASQSPFRLAIVNEEEGMAVEGAVSLNTGKDLIEALRTAAPVDGGQAPSVFEEEDIDVAVAGLRAGSVDLVIVVPHGFTATLEAHREGSAPPPSVVTTYGDPTNRAYLMAAAWSYAITYAFAAEAAEVSGPVEFNMQTVSVDESPGEFDLYLPSLLALAIIMLIFTAAASIIKEKDKGTLVRLRLSNMTTTEWLLAVTLVQIVLGVGSVAITLVTAVAIGYELYASFIALTLVSVLSSLAVVGVSVLVAAWLRTIFDLMTIGCFPFFILMFFSGGMFPLPDIRIFEVAGRSVNVNDILPTTHSISAFDRILNHGAGLSGVVFELAAITILGLGYFVPGTLVFNRRHMSANAV